MLEKVKNFFTHIKPFVFWFGVVLFVPVIIATALYILGFINHSSIFAYDEINDFFTDLFDPEKTLSIFNENF